MNSVQYRVAQPHVNSRTMESRRSHHKQPHITRPDTPATIHTNLG